MAASEGTMDMNLNRREYNIIHDAQHRELKPGEGGGG